MSLNDMQIRQYIDSVLIQFDTDGSGSLDSR